MKHFIHRQVNVVVLALLIYGVRLLGYSVINTPSASLFFEVNKMNPSN